MMKKIFIRILIGLISLIIIVEVILLFTGNTYVNKVVSMTLFQGKTGPDIDELELFPKHIVEAGAPQPWPISVKFGKSELNEKQLNEMKAYKTVSYLVIHHDSILYERNWEGYCDSSYVNSFSMAKSINASLIGFALKDGLIGSIDDPVGKYLEAFNIGNKAKITIRHLLTMSSGLDFKEEYASPLAWPAEAYYGDDVNALTLKAPAAIDPGVQYYYKGGDSQLLGMILKKVLHEKTVAQYASEKLWKPIGAEHPAYWSTDEKGMEKVSCCFYTNARDFARIAKLYLQEGSWNGAQLLDSEYVHASLRAAPLVDREGLPNDKYGFQWWLMKHQNQKIFYMRGIRGQYVFAIPELELIVVRLGHKRASKKGDELPSDIFFYLDAAIQLSENPE